MNEPSDDMHQPRPFRDKVVGLLREQAEAERDHFSWEETLADSNTDSKREYRALRQDAENRIRRLEPGV